MANFGTLKSRVSKRIGLDDTVGGEDDVLLGGYLNDGVRDFLLRTRANVNRAEIVITSESDDAELSSQALAINELYVQGENTRTWVPVKTTPQAIIDLRRAGSGVGSSVVGTHYALQGSDLFMFYPSLATGTVVVVYYVPRPTEMSTPANDPSDEIYGGISEEFHPALEMYGAWQMADVDDDATSQMGLSYQRQYMLFCKDAQRDIRRKGGRSLGPVQVGRRRPFRYARSQDLY